MIGISIQIFCVFFSINPLPPLRRLLILDLVVSIIACEFWTHFWRKMIIVVTVAGYRRSNLQFGNWIGNPLQRRSTYYWISILILNLNMQQETYTIKLRSSAVCLPPFLLPFCIECRRRLAMKILVRLSVCLSVCLTNAWCDKTKEICAHILIPHERPFTLVFWQEEWLVGRPLRPEILGQSDPVGAKSPILVDIGS